MCAWDAFIYHPGKYPIFLLLSGMVLADFRHMHAKFPRPRRQVKEVTTFVSYLMLTISLFFGTWPECDAANSWLHNFAPDGLTPARNTITSTSSGSA
jgi:hypothetical protein